MVKLACVSPGFRDNAKFCAENSFRFWKIFLVAFSFKLGWGDFQDPHILFTIEICF